MIPVTSRRDFTTKIHPEVGLPGFQIVAVLKVLDGENNDEAVMENRILGFFPLLNNPNGDGENVSLHQGMDIYIYYIDR